MFLCAFLAFQVSLALLAMQAHIWALFKMVDVLDLKSLPPVAVTTSTAAIGCGVPKCEAVLLADCDSGLDLVRDIIQTAYNREDRNKTC